MSFALITGASKGIGRAIAKEFAARKTDLLLVARNEQLLRELAEELKKSNNIRVFFMAIDLSQPHAAKKILDWCTEQNFTVTILVNNAGYGLSGAFDQYPVAQHIDMMQVNMTAPVELISALDGGTPEEKSYPLPAKDGTQIDKDNGTIITRWQGKVYVFSLACPHQNTALRWYDKDNAFECPKHHSRFLPDGEYVKDSGRATRNMDRFAVRKDGNNVVANLDKLYQQDEDEAPWTAAFVTV